MTGFFRHPANREKVTSIVPTARSLPAFVAGPSTASRGCSLFILRYGDNRRRFKGALPSSRVQNTRQTNTNWTHQKTYLSQKKARHFAGLLSIAQIQELEHAEIEKVGQLFRNMPKAKGLGCFLDFGFLGIDFLGLAAARAFLQLRFDHFQR
jgi:hypothetical protein